MQKYNGPLIRQFASSVTGNAASGVTVTVRRQSDSGLATLYADNNIAGATLSNPITTSSTGYFAFYAPDDVYTLTFSDSTPVQVIQLQDVAELQAQFDAAVLNAGYIPSGTFTDGATLTQANQVLSDGSSYWRWDGSFPKTVTAGSEPTPTGVGGWVLISDGGLRDELADTDSTVLIAGFQARQLKLIDGVKNLIAIAGVDMLVKGFYAGGSNLGYGQFYYDPSVSKTTHNGGTVIAPEAITAWDGTASDIATLLNWTGSGSGCFVRVYSGKINVVFFGAKGEYNSGTKTGVNDAKSWQKCIDVATAAGVEATSEGLKESFISERIFITCAFDGSHTTLYCKGGTIGSGSYAVYIQANKTVGTGALLSNTKISVPQLWNVDKPTTGWSGQCSGLQVNNVDSCMIDTKRGIVFFNNGMYVTSYTPDTAGTAYNDFFLGRIVYNNVNLFLQPVGTGYVNENNFYSGKLGDLTIDRSNTYLAILPPSGLGSGGPNANKFYGLTVEDGGTGTLATHILLGGPFNMFIGTRFEFIGARGKIVVWRENGNDPTDNLFVGGYSYGDYDVTATTGTPSATNTFKDVGRSPDIDGRFSPIYASVPSGGATPYQRLYEAGRNLFTATVADSDWTYQLTNGGGIQTKNAGATNAQTQLLGDRLYLGTGTGDINAQPFLRGIDATGIGTSNHDLVAGNGSWNGPHFRMGGFHFWVDSAGKFRMKFGSPTSDTDGAIVGTQS